LHTKRQKERKMAGRIEVRGSIGTSDNMKPTEILGKGNPFRTFRMWAEDLVRTPEPREGGNSYRPTTVVQVILPDGQRGENIFKALAGGRRVIVKGRLSFRPNVSLNTDGCKVIIERFLKSEIKSTSALISNLEAKIKEEKKIFPNPTIMLETIEFLDEQPEHAAERVINTLVNNCEVISHEQGNEFIAALKEHYSSSKNKINERVTKTIANDDPDDLGLK
jgi:predicted nucleic-acid-binding protein